MELKDYDDEQESPVRETPPEANDDHQDQDTLQVAEFGHRSNDFSMELSDDSKSPQIIGDDFL